MTDRAERDADRGETRKRVLTEHQQRQIDEAGVFLDGYGLQRPPFCTCEEPWTTPTGPLKDSSHYCDCVAEDVAEMMGTLRSGITVAYEVTARCPFSANDLFDVSPEARAILWPSDSARGNR